MKLKMIVSLFFSCSVLLGMNPNQSDKVHQHIQVLEKLSEEDKSKFAIYRNCNPDIQRVIRYYVYAQAIDQSPSYWVKQLMPQLKELKMFYNELPNTNCPYSFTELEKIAKAELSVPADEQMISALEKGRDYIAQFLAARNIQSLHPMFAIDDHDRKELAKLQKIN